MQIRATVSLYCCCKWFRVYRNNCCAGQAGCQSRHLCLYGAEVASTYPKTDVAVGITETRSVLFDVRSTTQCIGDSFTKGAAEIQIFMSVVRSSSWVFAGGQRGQWESRAWAGFFCWCPVTSQVLWPEPDHSILLERVQRGATELVRGTAAPPLWRQADKCGTVQPREEKVAWRPHSSLPVPEGDVQGGWRGTLHQEL